MPNENSEKDEALSALDHNGQKGDPTSSGVHKQNCVGVTVPGVGVCVSGTKTPQRRPGGGYPD